MHLYSYSSLNFRFIVYRDCRPFDGKRRFESEGREGAPLYFSHFHQNFFFFLLFLNDPFGQSIAFAAFLPLFSLTRFTSIFYPSGPLPFI